MKFSSSRACFILAFFLMSTMAGVSEGLEKWIPARWEGGPLEIERRGREHSLPTDQSLRETVGQWYDPSTLSLVQGTPINCLLVTWSLGGGTETEKQQRTLIKAYTQEAHKLGISILGLVYPGTTPSSIVESTVEARLEGLILEGEFPDGERLLSELRQSLSNSNSAAVVVWLSPRGKLTPSMDTPILAAADAVAPRIRDSVEGVEATPSSEPWIEFNIWLGLSLRSWGASRRIWFGERLAANAVADDYLRAIADAATGGGQWIVALSDELRHGLRLKQAEAMTTWRRMTAYLKFQQEHSDWQEFTPLADYGFIQDSAAKDRTSSASNLILAARQRIPMRMIERSQLSPQFLEGLQAVHGIDVIQPTDQERKILSAFAEEGGLVMVGPSWGQVELAEEQEYTVLRTGKGRVVVYRKERPEVTSLSKDLVDLPGRESFSVRFFRATSVLGYTSQDKASNRMLVQLVNYATYPADSVLVRVTGAFRSAHFYTPESAPSELALVRFDRHVEVKIPRLSVYGGLLLEK
jgi:hypothetical protein